MANSNVTDLFHQSQLKDRVSSTERLSICGIKHSPKNKKSAQKCDGRVVNNPSLVFAIFRAMKWSLKN